MSRLPSSRIYILLSCLLSTLAYRLFLLPLFAGWEESDYGNLAMVRGVYESGFRHFDMNHMPGYYAFAALGLFFTDDTELAAKAGALIPGLVSLAIAMFIMLKTKGFEAALILWALASFQPEFSLYSTSALREPLYSCWLMFLLLGIYKKKWLWAGIAAALAFTVRFEAPLVLSVVAFGAAQFKIHRILKLITPTLVTVFIWMIYCHFEHGTWIFWGHAAQVNIDTGLGEGGRTMAWFLDGLSVSFELLTKVLPWRLGLLLWASLFYSLILEFFKSGSTSEFRATNFLGLGLMSTWLGIAFIAQHEPSHNLYWKWLYPLVLPCLMMGISGLLFLNRLYPKYRWIVWAVVLSQAGYSYHKETNRQLNRSQELYTPQVELALWIEENVTTDGRLILDNIPACYLNRRPNEYSLVSWFDVPTKDEASFSEYLKAQDIRYVLWFEEDWTQAPRVAPFLSVGKKWSHGDVLLTEVRRDEPYGWAFFEVIQK